MLGVYFRLRRTDAPRVSEMPYLVGLAIVVAVVLAFWFYGRGNARRARGSDLTELRPAENKVKVSDPIMRRDIDILERYGSDLLPGLCTKAR